MIKAFPHISWWSCVFNLDSYVCKINQILIGYEVDQLDLLRQGGVGTHISSCGGGPAPIISEVRGEFEAS